MSDHNAALDILVSGLVSSTFRTSDRKKCIQKFQAYYFQQFPVYQPEQIRLLFKGKKSGGLCKTSGLTNSFPNRSLRKCSGLALGLIWSLVDEKQNRNAKAYVSVLTSLEAKYVNYLKLADHVRSSGSGANKAAAVNLQRLLNAAPDTVGRTTATASKVTIRKEKNGFLGNLARMLTLRPSADQLVAQGILKSGAVFAQPLEALEQKGNIQDGVPKIVREFISVLRAKHAQELTGLFRISGSASEIQAVKMAIDYGDPYDLMSCDPHSVAGLLKLYLRELPTPLFTFDHYEDFVEAFRAGDFDRLTKLFATFGLTSSKIECTTWAFICDFLVIVNREEASNKMTSNNIAIVFAPNILRPQVETLTKIQHDSACVIGAVEYSIVVARHKAGVAVPSDSSKSKLHYRVFGPPGESKTETKTTGSLPTSVSTPQLSLSFGSTPSPSTKVPHSAAPPQVATVASSTARQSAHVRSVSMNAASVKVERSKLPDKAKTSHAITRLRSVSDFDLHPDWKIHTDTKSGKSYYANSKTGVTTWTRPSGRAQRSEPVAEYLTEADSRPVVWCEEMRHSSQPNPYYFISSAPSTTSWTAPSDPAVLDTKVARSVSSLYQGYHCLSITGEWNQSNSGGCYPNYPSWRKNDQYRVVLKKGSNPASCYAQLVWVPDAKAPAPVNHAPIGIYIITNHGPSRQVLNIDTENLTARSYFVDKGDVGQQFRLEHFKPALQDALANPKSLNDFATHVTIIPMTHAPNQYGRYRLDVHAGADINLIKLTQREKWVEHTLNSEWKGSNAGGCREHPSFKNNTKYRLVSVHRQVFQIFLKQTPSSVRAPNNMQLIGLYVLAANGDIVAKVPFVCKEEVFCQLEYDVLRGPYIVVPCTYEPGKTAHYSLTAFAPMSFNMVQLQ